MRSLRSTAGRRFRPNASLSLLRTPSRGRAVKAGSNRTAVRTVTEPRDEASVLVFPFGRIRRDAAWTDPKRPTAHAGMPWSPMWKTLKTATVPRYDPSPAPRWPTLGASPARPETARPRASGRVNRGVRAADGSAPGPEVDAAPRGAPSGVSPSSGPGPAPSRARSKSWPSPIILRGGRPQLQSWQGLRGFSVGTPSDHLAARETRRRSPVPPVGSPSAFCQGRLPYSQRSATMGYPTQHGTAARRASCGTASR